MENYEEDKRENKKSNNNDLLSLIDISIYSPIKVLGFEKGKFIHKPYKQIVNSIKKSTAWLDIKEKIINVPNKHKDDISLYYCELYYFDIFKKAFGAPDSMKIEKSRMCISEKLFTEIINLL